MVKTVNPITFDKDPGGSVDRDFRPRHPSTVVVDDEKDESQPEVQIDPEALVTPPADGVAPSATVGLP